MSSIYKKCWIDFNSEPLCVVVIGDALAGGYPFDKQQYGFPAIDCTVANRSSAGNLSGFLLAIFEGDILHKKALPCYVLIIAGTEDAVHGTPLEEFVFNIDKIIMLAKQAKIVPVVFIPPQCGVQQIETLLGEYRGALIQLAEKYEVETVDLTILDDNWDDDATKHGGSFPEDFYCADKIYPNKEGYLYMWGDLGEWLCYLGDQECTKLNSLNYK